MSFVYLVRHATEPRFKIGKANDPFLRFRAFGEELDIDNSVQIHLGERSYGIEKGLQALFHEYRLPAFSDNDGATEWFKIECWSQCLEFFEHHYDLIRALPELIPRPLLTGSYLLTNAEKVERKNKKKEIQRRKIHTENLHLIRQWEAFLPWLAAKKLKDESIDEQGYLSIKLPGIPNEDARSFCNAKIGSSGFITEKDKFYPCGICEAHWDEEGEEFTLTLVRLSPDVMVLVRATLDLELRTCFEAMDAWIAGRIEILRILPLRQNQYF